MGSAAIDTYLINQNRSRISSFVRCLAVIRTSRSIRLSEQTTLPLMVWSSFIIPRNYKKEFIYYTIQLELTFFNGIFLVCFYRYVSGCFFEFLWFCRFKCVCYVWFSGWKIGLFSLSISFICIFSSCICKIWPLLPKRKEHRHSKDKTWIEDLRLPLRKGPLQPPLMELLNSFPLHNLTHRHRALACQFGFEFEIPSLLF